MKPPTAASPSAFLFLSRRGDAAATSSSSLRTALRAIYEAKAEQMRFEGPFAALLLLLRVAAVDAKCALNANHTASRKASFARAERE
jgi:hypothetical protein